MPQKEFKNTHTHKKNPTLEQSIKWITRYSTGKTRNQKTQSYAAADVIKRCKKCQGCQGQVASARGEAEEDVFVKGFPKTPPALWMQGKGEACNVNKGDTKYYA